MRRNRRVVYTAARTHRPRRISSKFHNGLHAVTALAAADMSLAGVERVIPPDEVIQAMYAIGNEMPETLRETGLGGLAATPTGKALRQKIFKTPCQKGDDASELS